MKMIASFSARNWSLFLYVKCVDDAIFVDWATHIHLIQDEFKSKPSFNIQINIGASLGISQKW